MKKFILPVLLSAIFCFSCEEQESITQYGTVQLSFNQFNDDASGRVSATPSSIVVSIETEDGQSIYNLEKINLIEVNGQLISGSLSLVLGTYKVTDFMLLDSSDSVLYLTPQIDSDFAKLVSTPLPHTFSIAAESETTLVMDVLEATLGSVEQFGYVSFSYNVVNPELRSLETGIVAHYPLNGNTNNVIFPYAHNGIGYDILPEQDRFDEDTASYLFNGQSSYINIGDSVANDVKSISMWFYSTDSIKSSNDEFLTLIARNTDYSTTLNGNEFSIAFVPYVFNHTGSNGRIAFSVRDSEGTAGAVFSESNSWASNEWHHLVATVDATAGLELYVDGALQEYSFEIENANIDKIPTAPGEITTIGCWGDLYDRYFSGRIDDVRFYNRRLTASEVSELYAF